MFCVLIKVILQIHHLLIKKSIRYFFVEKKRKSKKKFISARETDGTLTGSLLRACIEIQFSFVCLFIRYSQPLNSPWKKYRQTYLSYWINLIYFLATCEVHGLFLDLLFFSYYFAHNKTIPTLRNQF